MKHIDEFRDKELVKRLTGEISFVTTKEIALMKVSGSHSWAIQRFGIPSLLPKKSDLYRDRVVLFRHLQNKYT